MKNEKTGKRVSALAGKLLDKTKSLKGKMLVYDDDLGWFEVCSVAQFRSLAASCLTQAPDRGRKN